MGHFSTKIDLTMHNNLTKSLRYARLIGPSDDTEDLKTYSGILLQRWIKEQLVHVPNTKRVIDSWIIVAAELFDNVIVYNIIPINDILPVQLTAIYTEIEQKTLQFVSSTKKKILDAAILELGDTITLCDIPDGKCILLASKGSLLVWNVLMCYCKSPSQPELLLNKK
eukprot:15365531-Ditylum_brightwellii.AAC.1